MIQIREFITSGGKTLNDADLMTLIKARMPKTVAGDQRGWLRQLELSLDGYGGAPQLLATQRVRVALKDIDALLDVSAFTAQD